jgi:hypothetical protein
MAPVVDDRRGGVTGTGWAFVTADRDLAPAVEACS